VDWTVVWAAVVWAAGRFLVHVALLLKLSLNSITPTVTEISQWGKLWT